MGSGAYVHIFSPFFFSLFPAAHPDLTRFGFSLIVVMGNYSGPPLGPACGGREKGEKWGGGHPRIPGHGTGVPGTPC